MASQAALDLVINLKGADKAESGLERLAKTATSLGKGMSTLAKVGFAAAAGGAVALVGSMGAAAVSGLRFNSSLENVTAQLNAFTKDGAKSAEILEMIRDRAAKTPFSFEAMATAAAGLLPASKMANESLESIIETAEVLAASNPAEGLEGAAFAIREAVSGDFASAIERFNLPRQMINQLKEEGVPNIEIIRRAMQEMGYDVDLVNNLAETATGRWSTFMDTLQGLAATATGPLFEGLSSGLGTVNQWLTDNSASLEAFAAGIGERLGAAFNWLVNTGIPSVVGAFSTLRETTAAIYQALTSPFEDATMDLNTILTEFFGTTVANTITTGVDTYIRPALQGVREGFGLARDAVITFIQAFSGEWENVPGKIHPLHQAFGDFGKEARAVIDWLVQKGLPSLVAEFEEAMPANKQLIDTVIDALSRLGAGSKTHTEASASSVEAMTLRFLAAFANSGAAANKFGLYLRDVVTVIIIPAFVNMNKEIQNWGEGVMRWLDTTANAMLRWVGTVAGHLAAFSLAVGRAVQGFIAEIQAVPAKVAAAAAAVGVSIVTGVAAGIRSAPGAIGGALGKMVGDAIASAQRLIRAHSPAEETAEKIGEPMAQGITKGFVGRMTEDQRKILNSIADTIGKVASAVSSTVKAMTDLSGFKGGTVTGPQLQGLLGGVALIITQIEELAEGFKTEGLEAASKFTEHAGRIVGVISSGVTALTALAKWEPTTISGLTVQNLLQGMALVIVQIEEMAEGFRQEGMEAAAQFAESAGKVVGVIDDAIGGLSALSKWKPAEILGSTVQNLLQGVALVVVQMQEMAEGFEQEGLAAAGLFADAVGKVLAPLKTAIDTFKGLKDFESVAADRMEALAAGIHLAVYWMTEIAKGLDQEATKLAAEISDDVGRIFGALKGGLDFLEGLKDYEGVGPETMQRLLDDMVKMTEHVAAMAKGAFDQAEMSIAWLSDVTEFADNYKAAVALITGLPAYPEYPGMPNPPSGGGGGGTTNDGTLDSGDQLNFGVSSLTPPSSPTYAAAAAPNVNNYTLVQHITTPMHPDTEFGWMQSVWAGVG